MNTKHPQHRNGAPAQVDLKHFYSMKKEDREEHINELKKLNFKELSQVDLSIIYFWYQNWQLTEFPKPQKKFITLNEEVF